MILKQFKIKPKNQFTDITNKIKQIVNNEQFKTGLCLIYTKHTTALVRILENEKLLMTDMHNFLEQLAPSTISYGHDNIEQRSVPKNERKNGFSHLRAMFLNNQELIPIINNKLDLGKWQSIFYIDTDFGHKNRTFNICLFEVK